MACAVIAMMGVCPPLSRSISRIRRVAFKPSISGICTSMKTRSNFPFVTASTASRPFSACDKVCPCFAKIPVATARFTTLSSASKMRRPDVEGPSVKSRSGSGELPVLDLGAKVGRAENEEERKRISRMGR